jgi:hypothetical protein
MSQALFSLPYFGPLSYYASLIKYDSILIESAENYQKQTYRNRQYIYGANGKLMLNIPVKHSKSKHRSKYIESEIENDFNWQELHFKSLESAYRTSPYFEFYEADIEPLFKKKYTSLFQFNLTCFKTLIELLNLEFKFGMTESYQKEHKTLVDCRNLVSAKKKQINLKSTYHQVFEDKYGFIPDLSILDLLFNLGPESTTYLKSIS